MSIHVFDPTAGETARRLRMHPDALVAITDPMVGERARALHEHPERSAPITDPTDPRAQRRSGSRRAVRARR